MDKQSLKEIKQMRSQVKKHQDEFKFISAKMNNQSNTTNQITTQRQFQIFIQSFQTDHSQPTDNYQPILNHKIIQLQKICIDLSHTNNSLLQKLKLYQSQNHQNNSIESIDQYDLLQKQLTAIHQLIQNYKKGLLNYHQLITKQSRNQEDVIKQLKLEIKDMIETNANLTQSYYQLANINNQLQTSNKKLFQENQHFKQIINNNCTPIKLLRDDSQKLLSRTSNGVLKKSYQGYYEDQNEELEILVDRLIDELQQQKKTKKQMNEQIKKLKKEIIQYSKEIMEKNNKIYLLEIKSIKSLKDNKSNPSFHKFNHITTLTDNNQLPNTFTIIQLLNGEYQLYSKNKLQIAHQILKLFQRKIYLCEYSQIMLQDLEIVNFNEKVNQFCVRHIGRSKNQNQKIHNKEDLVWNLAFIIDNLLNQVPNKSSQEENQELINGKNKILELTDAILYKRNSQIDRIDELRRVIDKSLQQIN